MLLLIKERKRKRKTVVSVSLQPVELVALGCIDCCLKKQTKNLPE